MVGLVLLVYACTKPNEYEPVEHYPVPIHLKGKVVDAKTGLPLANIPLRVEESGIDLDWNWYFVTLAQSTTLSDGSFQLDFMISSDLSTRFENLKIDSLLPGYQYGARINGTYGNAFCTIEGEGFPITQNNGSFLVELFPVTQAYFAKPAIPAGWELDTLSLEVTNLIEYPGSSGWECMDIDHYPARFELRLNNLQKWLDLKKARNVFLGDKLSISYTIRNGAIKKSGNFNAVCPIGETTMVELPLW